MPEARVGQCFARVLIPATYEKVAQEVVTADAYERATVTQAQFAARQQQVVTRDAYKRYVVREPVFRAESQTIVTRPAYERLVVVPGTMGTRTETVQIREPRLVWRPGHNLSGIRRMDPSTGDVFCLVEEPGKTQVISRTVVTSPETVRRETVPAEVRTVARHVLVEPARVEEIAVPAVAENIVVHELTAPATSSRVAVGETRGRIYREVIATPERYEWIPVVCDTKVTPATVHAIQRALAQRGLYRGPIDGIIGPMTQDALKRFQAANGIAHNGYLSVETLQKLGVSS